MLCDAGDSDLCELQTKKCEKNHTQTQTDEKTETTRRREGLRPFTLEDSRLLSPSVLKCSDERVVTIGALVLREPSAPQRPTMGRPEFGPT